jgi:hypothetical protein
MYAGKNQKTPVIPAKAGIFSQRNKFVYVYALCRGGELKIPACGNDEKSREHDDEKIN